jgi:hypothetical protein
MYHVRVLRLPESCQSGKLTQSPFFRRLFDKQERTCSQAILFEKERSVELLQDSHSRVAFFAAGGFLHPALEYECLVQWIGATDTIGMRT